MELVSLEQEAKGGSIEGIARELPFYSPIHHSPFGEQIEMEKLK